MDNNIQGGWEGIRLKEKYRMDRKLVDRLQDGQGGIGWIGMYRMNNKVYDKQEVIGCIGM